MIIMHVYLIQIFLQHKVIIIWQKFVMCCLNAFYHRHDGLGISVSGETCIEGPPSVLAFYCQSLDSDRQGCG